MGLGTPTKFVSDVQGAVVMVEAMAHARTVTLWIHGPGTNHAGVDVVSLPQRQRQTDRRVPLPVVPVNGKARQRRSGATRVERRKGRLDWRGGEVENWFDETER
jgi:hypothetical protein